MKQLSEEHKRKIAQSLMGRKHSSERRKNISEAHKGQAPWNKGLKTGPQSEDVKLRRRAALLKTARRGSFNHFWKGGITPLNKAIRSCTKYQEWRTFVFIRDGRRCVFCGESRNINADHIMPLSVIVAWNRLKTLEQALACDELWNVNNGRTMCESCHKKTITYGNKSKMHKLVKELKEVICKLSKMKSE